jgi:hypothetical protein
MCVTEVAVISSAAITLAKSEHGVWTYEIKHKYIAFE